MDSRWHRVLGTLLLAAQVRSWFLVGKLRLGAQLEAPRSAWSSGPPTRADLQPALEVLRAKYTIQVHLSSTPLNTTDI